VDASLGSVAAMTDRMPDPAHRHRAIFESAVDFAIIATDCDGRITDWNTGAERILGWSAAEMQGELADRIFTPEDRLESRPAVEMRCALEAGQANDERWHLKKDNSRFWASGEMMPLRDDVGAHLGFLKILRDRTEQLHATQAQQADAEFLRSILASSADCIKVLDLDANLIFMSEGGQRVMEVSDFNAIRGCPWPNFWKAKGNADAIAAVEAAKAGKTGHFQGPAQTVAGTPRWWDVQVTPILGADGQPAKLLSVSRDITERKRLETELRHINANLEQRVATQTADRNRLWRLSTDIMLVARFDGIIAAVNPACAVVLGWTERELVGRNMFELIHPDDLDRSADVARTLAQGSTLRRFDNRYRHKNGTYRWIAWMAVPGDDFINAVGRDVTAEKEQGEALRQAEEQLRQSQKMEAVGQLTGGLAHDFNNLLAGISGSLELLQTRMSQGRINDLDRYIAAAQGGAKRAAALTHRLLAFSRQQTLDPKPTNVNRLVTGMEELIRRTAGPAIEIEVVGAAGLWTTLIDPGQLENALLNLCINARDAMPDGGRLTIETANKWLDGQTGRERDLTPGQYLSLCVTDTGTGMTPEVIARAFDPFFTTKPIGMGTGLGLSMIYGFARQSGGQVRIYSEVGQGTTMCLYLPRHHGQVDAADASAELTEAPGAEQGETVLVVDDEPTVRMLVTEVLEDLGYTAIEAADSAAGLRVLRSAVRIDLLVTDLGLPGGMNGRQMADAGRAVRPGLRVLFITGYAENAVVGNGHLEPGMQVLTKPFAMDALASRIRELITAP